VTYDDETLMAFADGELDEAKRAEISAAIERDPDLARRVAQHRALRNEVAGAFAGVVDQPVPARLREAAAVPAARGNVVKFPTKVTRALPTPWRAREWTAMAASLLVGVFVAGKLLPDKGEVVTRMSTLVASGELVNALDTQLAGTQAGESPVHIGLTFRDQRGAFCRSFISRSMSVAGLACREGDAWRIEQTHAVELGAQADLRQAAAAMPAPLIQSIEARISGDALDAKGEAAARDAGWR
jgi:hypothetical protein